MVRTDPAPEQESIYECLDCGSRIEESELDGRICSCGGYLQDISLPRPQ